MKLLESQAEVQYPRDGALLNYFATSKMNGKLNGCSISFNSTTINISAGILSVLGYRIVFDEPEAIFTITQSTSLTDGWYKCIIKLTATDDDATAEIEYKDSKSRVRDAQIQLTTGVYDYTLCTFQISGNQIIAVTNKIKEIVSGQSNQTSSTTSTTLLPSPQINIIHLKKYTGYLLQLANVSEYNQYIAEGYKLRLQMIRYVGGYKYNYVSRVDRSLTLRHRKSGYVMPKQFCRWNPDETAKYSMTIPLLNLYTHQYNSSISFKNIIEDARKVIESIFYEDTGVKNTDGNYIKQAITVSTNPSTIRATRSKRKKQTTKYHHHSNNYFRYAYVIEVLVNNEVVATSGKSNDILIRPNTKIPTEKVTTIEDLFEVKIV